MTSLPLVQHAPPPPLPIEIIEEVIDQAGDDRSSLRRLSLLCKSLSTRARLHLFTVIVIRDVEHMESSREFLESHPWVPPLVRKVTLIASHPGAHCESLPLLDIVRVHLFTQLPNLHAWEMRAEGELLSRCWLSVHRSMLLCYRIYGANIQNLELQRVGIRDISHFVQLVSAFTGLHSLTCFAVELRKEHSKTSEHDSEILNKPTRRPLKMQHLTVSFLITSYAMYGAGS